MKDQAVTKLQKDYHGSYADFINWPLTRSLDLGDIGKWSSGKTFTLEESVTKYGIKLATRGGATVSSRAFTSAAGVDIKFKAEGSLPPANTALLKAKAGVSIALNSNSSCVLRARNLREETVADKPVLEGALKGLGKDSDWWKHRIVITSIIKADIATVVLARSGGQRVDINADVETAIPFEIADASLGLQIGYQGAHTVVELLVLDVVLAFQYSKLRKGRWWHSWERSSIVLTP